MRAEEQAHTCSHSHVALAMCCGVAPSGPLKSAEGAEGAEVSEGAEVAEGAEGAAAFLLRKTITD